MLSVFLAYCNAMGQTPYGTDDLIISDAVVGNTAFNVNDPSIAYGSQDGLYLVVWVGDNNTGGYVDNEVEIWGRLISSSTLTASGSQFVISQNSTIGNDVFDQTTPEVVYNSSNNEFLVVWAGDCDCSPLVDNEFEIYGQRVDASDGSLNGSSFKISTQGPDGDDAFDAIEPSAAYNSTNNEYLVVWSGDRISGEDEIYGAIIDHTGANVVSDFRISSVGTEGAVSGRDGEDANVAWNSTTNNYLVVWRGDPVTNNDSNIFGQLISSAGAEIGTDFAISGYGAGTDANQANLVYNSTDNEYLVIWSGDGATLGGEAVRGQRIDASGNEVGTDDFIIYDPYNSVPDITFDVSISYHPGIAWNSNNNTYLVVCESDNSVNGDQGIFAIAVTDDTTIGSAVLIGDATGGTSFDFEKGDVAFNPDCSQFLACFRGEEAPLASGDDQIGIQFLGTQPTTSAGVPTISASSTNICSGASTTLNIDAGNLNDAFEWVWYNGDPTTTGTEVGAGTALAVTPTSTTTYYARGESSCLSPGTTANLTIEIEDTTDPVITCPGNQAENAVASCNFSLPDYTGMATATDNCDSNPALTQSPVAGTTISSAGTVQTVTLTATDATGNSSFCTFDVTIIEGNTGTDTRTECNPYTWIDGNIYTANNNTATFNMVGGAMNGCDSLVTLDLTINTVDVEVNATGTAITANATGASYKWLDCNNNFAFITGETAQTFTGSNGSYAVEVTQNICKDTSACVNLSIVAISVNEIPDELAIYPNPNQRTVNIDLGSLKNVSIHVHNLQGQMVYQKEGINSKIYQFELNEPAGVYFVEVGAQGKKQKYKFVLL